MTKFNEIFVYLAQIGRCVA